MRTVVLIGIEEAATAQIRTALSPDSHWIDYRNLDVDVLELLDANIVFCGGKPADYLLLLKRVRELMPGLPFIVVTKMPDTTAWLDALEAGATDYISPPFESRQLHWTMESALPSLRAATAS